MSWPLIPLSDICDLQNGYAFKSNDYVNLSKTLSCRMSNIRPGGGFDINYNARYLPDDFSEKYSQFLLEDGDVVIAMTDLADSPKILGVPTIINTNGKNILLNQRVGKLIIKDSKKVFFPYLKLALNYPKVRSVYKQFAGGGLQINLGKADLLSVEIPLPPLPEQKRIAAILDKADAIRRKRQQAIQLADDFLRAVFLDMFGDPVTNPKGWPLKRFGDVGTWSSGGTPSRTVSDFFEGEINWYSAGELNSRYLDGSVEKISESAIKNSAAKIFKKDSLLVGMYDTAAMKISILKEDSSCNQACANVECNELASVEWLYSYIDYAKDSYLSRRRGVRQKNLNLGMIRDFLLPLPPRDLQDEFVRFVSAVFGMKKKQDECKDFPVFESLSLKAFSGQL